MSPVRPDYKKSPARFEGTSESRDAYKSYDIERRAAPAFSPAKRVAIPFDATTTTGDEYKAWPLPAKPEVHAPEFRARPDDRDFNTEARGEYTSKHVERCPASYLPPAPSKAAAPDAWADGHVLYDRRHGTWAS